MARSLVLALLASATFAPLARADDPMAPPAPPAAPAPAPAPAPAVAPAPAAKPAPTRASDEDAQKALVVFREAWKAKGLKGDEKLSQRDWALDELSKVQHPLVAAELGSVAKAGEGDLRLMAVIYLARQKAVPGVAGEQVLQALQRAPKDVALVLSALQSLGKLKYLGAGDILRDLLKNEDWAVRKGAINTVGQVGDMRLLEDLLKILGVDVKNAPPAPGDDKKGGKEVVEEGYSWEGAEAVVDHGDADNTKENAEAKAQAEAQAAKNKAEAGAGKSGGGGDGPAGAGTGTGGGRGGSSRNPSELKPYALRALKALTGETFMNGREIYAWVVKNAATVATKKQECAAGEAVQKAEPKK